MMNGNVQLMEIAKLVSAIPPVDLSTAANNGDWVSLKFYDRCVIFVFAAVGTSGDNPVITLKQATDVTNSLSDAKALNFTTIYSNVATALTSGDAFTAVTQAAANTYQSATAGDAAKQRIYAIEVKASDLDIDNGFDCLQVSIPDSGTNAQLGGAFYLLYGSRYAGSGTALPSAITN
jgi:hypothetical protein